MKAEVASTPALERASHAEDYNRAATALRHIEDYRGNIINYIGRKFLV